MKLVCQIVDHKSGNRTEEFVLSRDDLYNKLVESADKAEVISPETLGDFLNNFLLIIGTYEDDEGFKVCKAPLCLIKSYLISVNPGYGTGSNLSPEPEPLLDENGNRPDEAGYNRAEFQDEIDFGDGEK